ncbi:protein of unknown function [Mesobacillus persicus]|uniref:DUF4305 domain-containing protein n=1 Tax=Mesobacillus persicus TaxID=930146 RepID=A0A1H8KH21_9BACI|nr:YdiK family protein [Mesobacillus persicus]SEN92273.1 protein of unknown function [Mesobacillus persicus]
MKQSPLFSGIVYIVLGLLFTYLAVENVTHTGWGFFSYLLVLLATFDIGSGIRMIQFHFKLKNIQKKS